VGYVARVGEIHTSKKF